MELEVLKDLQNQGLLREEINFERYNITKEEFYRILKDLEESEFITGYDRYNREDVSKVSITEKGNIYMGERGEKSKKILKRAIVGTTIVIAVIFIGIMSLIEQTPESNALQYLLKANERIRDHIVYNFDELHLDIEKINEEEYILVSNNFGDYTEKEKIAMLLSARVADSDFDYIKEGIKYNDDVYTVSSKGTYAEDTHTSSILKNGIVIYQTQPSGLSQYANVSNKKFTKDEMIFIAEKDVKKNLKSPTTAKFSNIKVDEDTVTGVVTSQNSYGAELTVPFSVTFENGNTSVLILE